MSMMSSFVCARLLKTTSLVILSEEIDINVSHSQGDGICVNAEINADELQKLVSPYLTAFDKLSPISSSESNLRKKLDYFIEIYNVYSIGKLLIKCQSHGGSYIDSQFYLENLEWLDTNYQYMMSIEGNVYIGRYFLERFIKNIFYDFLEFVSNEISKSLYDAYQTISDASMNMYDAQINYSYSRKINQSLMLKIRIQEDAYGEIFNPSEEYGETQTEKFDYALSHFDSIANGKDIPALANLLIVDEDMEEVFSFSRNEYFMQVNDGVKFCDRSAFIIEALSEFREQCA
ncbi:UNVERIFIED_ORG: hypothetical protein M2414_004137 [Rahnella aquatilis]